MLTLAAAATVLVATGCQGSGTTAAGVPGSTPSHGPDAVSSSPAAVHPTIAVTPADSASGVGLDKPVLVTAGHGTLSSVAVADAKGTRIDGAMADGGRKWSSSGSLNLSATYHVTAKAKSSDGTTTTKKSTFTTVRPKATAYPSVIPLRGETVGVGMVIRVMFDHPVGDKAATQKLLKVHSSKPVVGAWHWFGNDEVHYRTKKFWPAHDKVTLDINIGHKNLGGGVYGQVSRHVPFTVGDSMITKVSNRSKSLKVYKNGRLAKTVPVSLGKAKTPSVSGTMLVMTDQHPFTMNSASFGVPPDAPGGYKTTVQYALRLSNSGQFLHSAPWSVKQQGHTNVSHGCININPAAAKWFYDNSHRGDVVEVAGTGHQIRPGDGWTDWRFSWSHWMAGVIK